MPVIKAPQGKVPEGSYLAVHMGNGEIANVLGATFFLVEPDEDPLPLWLVKVTSKALTFRCSCKRPECTRVMKFNMHATGFHPPKYKTVTK